MKTYQIELKRTSYVNMTFEANSEEEAKELAWAELASDGSYGDSDFHWELESVEELHDDPETETGEDLAQFFGPSAR
jgi:hypothetical protein